MTPRKQLLPLWRLPPTLLLLLLVVRPSQEFVPGAFRKYLLNVFTGDFSSYDTHKDMTKSAVLSVARDVLRDNPNSESEGSSQRIAALRDPIDETSLLTAYYGEKRRNRIRQFENAIQIMADANAEVDSKEKSDAAAHFDSESFQAGQNRLLQKKLITGSYITRGDFDAARKETGRLLHTLQDFYSHSNWIENGNLSPYRVLGNQNERPKNIAKPSVQTCTDCTKIGSRYLGIVDALTFGLFLKSSSVYECNNNINTGLRANGILTSGYHGGQRDVNNQLIEKPSGKCSHGGFLDDSSDFYARGGINKDSPNDKWSPHHYLFNDAAAVATQASIDFLQDLRREIRDDQLFANFLGIALLNSDSAGDDGPGMNTVASVAYVIDTTGSMSEELPEIQATIPTIRRDLMDAFGTNMQVRYILVPFNDPDDGTTFVTRDIDSFLAAIAELRANGGGDTPEPSIGALIRAIRYSEPGSSVFVFTDAPASDEHLVNEALMLINEKQVTVNFALVTNARRRRRHARDTSQTNNMNLEPQAYKRHIRTRTKKQSGTNSVYEELATLSGGQILNIATNDISEIGSLVSFSAVEGHAIIFRKSGVAHATVEHFFPVDSYSAEIIISISGDSVGTSVYAPGDVDATTLPQYSSTFSSTTLFIASINTTESSLQGTWRLSIQSQGAYSILIMAASDLTFSLTLFQRDPSDDYGVSEVIGKSLVGQLTIALVELHGVSQQSDVTITEINLVNRQGTILFPISNVTQLNPEKIYFVNFVQPVEPYQLQLIGVDSSGLNFSRISDLSIESTSISLSLGEDDSGSVVLRPGENVTITLTLLNNGSEASAFTLTVNTIVTGAADNGTDFFGYNVNPVNTIILTQQSNTTVDIGVYLFENATLSNGVFVTFTVIATSDHDESINDFVSFDIVTTTLPLPKFTENEFSNVSVLTTTVTTASVSSTNTQSTTYLTTSGEPSIPLLTTMEVTLASLVVLYAYLY